jgi:hypothetical protein
MRWAILDSRSKIVKRIVESEDLPRVEKREEAVNGEDESCAVGRYFAGWTFEEKP